MRGFIISLLILTTTCSPLFSQEESLRGDVKFSSVMNNIRRFYVDSINEPHLVEVAIKALMKELDPHSVYLTREEIDRANESLTGSFDGVGITFQIYHDSVLIISTLREGPAHRTGLRAGDRILRIGSDTVPDSKYNNTWVVERLRGDRGSSVEVEVFRKTTGELLTFVIKRDKIPIYSIETSFMLDSQTGYIKLSRFSGKTMSEFYAAFIDLKFSGMQNIILDLRGNSGGYLQTAIDLADEFLTKGNLIVYTEGLNHPRYDYRSTSKGEFENGKLIILIDETSASASEILAGAVQDCDRGLIIGRRSYGKGLVQRPYYLPDGSAIRLTTARYYTPSGRSIQKPYKKNGEDYFKDLSFRLKKGEYISADSIKFPDSLRFVTINNRTVYGGGGIMPDIFIPLDTSVRIPWFRAIHSANLPYNFMVQYMDDHRLELVASWPSFQIFDKYFSAEGEILDSFLLYCGRLGHSTDSVDISAVLYRLPVILKAHLASLLFDNTYYYRITAILDNTLMQSLEIMNERSYFKKNKISY